jgi:hypothetical protein
LIGKFGNKHTETFRLSGRRTAIGLVSLNMRELRIHGVRIE